MFKSFLIIIFIFNFQFMAKAEKITDFEVEGITVGDSLLAYMNANDIKNNDLGYYPNNSKFTAIHFVGKKDTYEYVIVYVKRNDTEYKIHLIRAINTVKGKNDCIESKKNISARIVQMVPRVFAQRKRRRQRPRPRRPRGVFGDTV